MRLHAQWPRVPAEQLQEVASEIVQAMHRQLADPEIATVKWLLQVIPDAA